MTPFTDDDLKRLQEEMGTIEQERWIRGETNLAPLEALIARLEAAETFVEIAMRLDCVDSALARQAIDAGNAWRKAAGK